MMPQDHAASDSLEPAIQLFELSLVMRHAIELVRGVEISIEDDLLRFSLLSPVSWFKVRVLRKHHTVLNTPSACRVKPLCKTFESCVATAWGPC
jgi:hypothetical protein